MKPRPALRGGAGMKPRPALRGGAGWLRLLGWLLMAAGWAIAGKVGAQDTLSPFHLRAAASSALMVSSDQRSWLGFDRPGALLDVQLAYSALRWLDVQVGATGGLFFSREPGGLISPTFGLLARSDGARASPYALFDLGIGFTGRLLRPFSRLGGGIDYQLSRALRAGPSLGLGIVTQWDTPGYSSSAIYAWLGLSATYGVVAMPQPRAAEVERRAEPRALAPDPELDALVRSDEPPPPPSTHVIEALLDDALPNRKSELLAPVLFDFDSDALNPSGIAMLHEVERVLRAERSEIELLEIEAYSDARGGEQHNLELARRRAERVRTWLVAHGVAAERLQLKALGATDFVEPGGAEEDHQQNRRVVFRVLRTRKP